MSRHLSTLATALATLALIITTGCSESLPTAPQLGPEDALARMGGATNPTQRPLAQRSHGAMQPTGPCVGGVGFTATGQGLASHVGRFDIQLDWCMNPLTGAVASGAAAVTAANGDRVDMTLTGLAPSPSRLILEATIVGGTGRFDGSSGRLGVDVMLDADGEWSSQGEGWISY